MFLSTSMKAEALDYEIRGEGHPFLLLHGALISRSMWTLQLQVFSKSFQVITCDLPVHGTSPDLEGEYTIEALSQSVIRLLDGLKISHFHLCGHSLGGMVAQYLAVVYPERISKLVLAETSFGTRYSRWERLQTSLARSLLSVVPHTTLVNLSARRYGSLNDDVAQFIRKEMMTYERATTLRVMEAAFSFDGKAQLERITAPTLILVGSDNKIIHGQAKWMQKHIPNARLQIIPQAHHLPNLDNPEVFHNAVLNFLSET
jgi:3-oxoadipate enol-lactonase